MRQRLVSLLLPVDRFFTPAYNGCMPHEVEAKFAVPALEPIRQELEERQARPLGELLQTDRFFDLPEGTYFRNGCGLRLRELAVLDPAGRDIDDRPVITFKGPVQEGRLKTRREIETRLDDPDAARQLLRACGLHCVRTIQKKRRSYRLGECTVELDELPLLGTFVEIEGPDEATIDALAESLNIPGPHVPDAYVQLLADRAEQLGKPHDHVTFDT